MTDFSYIHIAFRGEMQGATRTLYKYTPADSDKDPRWDSTMVEPGAAIKRFLNANECYVLQESALGHYISLITRNTLFPERGYVMISLLIDNGCALTGRQVLGVFAGLKRVFIEEENLSDDAVETVLLEAGVPKEPLELEAWKCNAAVPAAETVSEAAYRTYISPQELEAIFSFPGQPEYAGYRCIIIVSASTSLRPGVKMPRITVPIRRQYGVVCPEGVTASSSLVYDGDRLVLTYSREGFDTHTETVVVGTPAAYTKYEGSTILVRTAAQTGIRFVRRVPVKVRSMKGASLNGYTISVNGHPVSTADPYIEFTERDLESDTEVDIQVVSNNYRPLKLKMPSSEILATDELDMELQPVEQCVTLRLDFGDGRVFEQQISIEKNTPEYNRLHSGNFHGFRAHRQVTSDNSEVYNVDVRIVNPPVAPNFDPSHSDDSEEGRNVAPKFVNVSGDIVEEHPRIDSKVPVDPRSRQSMADGSAESAGDECEDDYPASSSSRRKALKWLGLGLLGLAIVVAVALLIPEGNDLDVAPSAVTELAADGTGGTAADSVAAPAVPMTQEEAADAEYLNGNAAWDLTKLSSPMGKALAKALTDGDLNAVVENDYFSVRGRCTNRDAAQIVDMAWKAIGSPNERGNARKLRQSVSNGSIVLREAVNALAKVRPAENVNERPRPQK